MKADGFVRESDYLETVLETRDRLVKGLLPFGNAFLDDCLGGLFPDDLVVFSAGPGVGKTQLLTTTAMAALEQGVEDVRMFSLEDRPGAVSERSTFMEMMKHTTERVDFAEWHLGNTRKQEKEHWAPSKRVLKPMLDRLHTLYRGKGEFTNKMLAEYLEKIKAPTRLVVLDYLQCIDTPEGRENATQKKTVQLLADLATRDEIAVVTASQLRKPPAGENRRLVHTLNDMKGAGEISAVLTRAIVVARDFDTDRPMPHLSPTYFKVVKCRKGRSSPYIARMLYNEQSGRYENRYTLGREVWRDKGVTFDALHHNHLPKWAVREVRNQESKPF